MRSSQERSAAVLIAAFSLAGSGCSLGLTYSASANRSELVDKFPFRAARPIARELRYTYVSATVLGTDVGQPLVSADAATRSELPPGRHVVSLAAQPLPQQSGGTKWSEIFAERAAEARRDGRTQDAALNTQLSQANLGTELATARMVSSASGVFAIYAGAVQALRAVGQGIVDGTAVGLRDWITANTGAIGPAAPEGSVLRLQLFAVANGEKFKSEIRLDYVAIATLEDGRGRTVQSARSWQVWGHKAEGSAFKIPADVTRFDPAHMVPADKQGLLQPLSNKAWAPQLALAANAAVADLYARLDAISGQPRQPRD